MPTFAAVFVAFGSMFVLGSTLAWSNDAAFQPISKCGFVRSTKILHVRSLDPYARDGLASVLARKGPKIVVFDVGGTIDLADKDLEINQPQLTIAGESAPSPGIVITGGTVRIRTHDVCIRHIAVRPGSGPNDEVNDRRDGIAIGGNPKRFGAIERILLENVSVTWGIDENLSVWHEGTRDVQIRSALIAEGLMQGGHPKGNHSMGMLVGSDVYGVSVTRSLFANNNDRNPRMSAKTQISVSESVVANPGNMSTEVFLDCNTPIEGIALVDNLFLKGPSTRRGREQYVFVDSNSRKVIGDRSDCPAGFQHLTLKELPGGQRDVLLSELLAHSGSRPKDRAHADRRIVEEVRANTGRLKNASDPEVDLSPLPQTQRLYRLPLGPLKVSSEGQMAIEVALCRAHLELGGLPYKGCK